MRIVHLNNTDTGGGAPIAACRLLYGQRKCGLDAVMLVKRKMTCGLDVVEATTPVEKLWSRMTSALDRLPLRAAHRTPDDYWSLCWIPVAIASRISTLSPDVINLHWIGGGFVPIRELSRIRTPIVWTLHDSWAFTGGCHIPQHCTRYQQQCGRCPQLDSASDADMSRWVWNRKNRAWRHINMTLVSPSRWLAACARSSSLFADMRIEVIPNGIDTDLFKPMDKMSARRKLGLPEKKKIILTGAMNFDQERKGRAELFEALQLVPQTLRDEAVIAVIGSCAISESDLPFKIIPLGAMNDEDSIVSAYSAADVYVHPSRQENLSNMIMEAMSCGTPVAAFDVGGNNDMVEDQINGRIAKPFCAHELAESIQWILAEKDRHSMLSLAARRKICREFAIHDVVARYLELYEDILATDGIVK